VTERLILIGFMCSGKSTVGRLVAEALDWDFIDFDEAIESRTGKRIVEIFRDHGEDFFRGLEAATTHEVADLRRVVLAPGGGWVTQSDLVDLLRADSHIVWLRVGPETVLERHAGQTGAERPLLSVDDPLATARSMLSEREPLYRLADTVVDTDGHEVETVAVQILESLGRGEPSGPVGGC
jgi:shikimate kinase